MNLLNVLKFKKPFNLFKNTMIDTNLMILQLYNFTWKEQEVYLQKQSVR